MRKQLIAAGAAALLAIGGIIVLVAYANGADDRALEGTKTVDVIQVVKEVPKGTAASDLGDSVALKKLPRSAVAAGSISNINDVDGLVTSAALQPGEQLLTSRFAKKGAPADSSVPKGYQEVTIPLTRARLVGASVAAGDRVGIIVSFEPKGNVPQISAMALNQVLVTKVEATPLKAALDENVTGEITFAVKTLDAEKIVYGSEWGKVWLTKQTSDTDTTGGKTIDYKDVAK